MATYNGARFLRQQVDSILAEIDADDELVVVDDCSTDSTIEQLNAYEDNRIKVHVNAQNRGHVLTFERAISLAAGEVILLTDQDDVWPRGRVDTFINRLSNAAVAASSVALVDLEGKHRGEYTLSERAANRRFVDAVGLLAGRRPYFGCAMGFRRGVLASLLPFPRQVEAHDHWLALVGSVRGGVEHIADVTVLRTLHDSNLTPTRRRSLPRIVGTRLRMIWLLGVATWRSSNDPLRRSHNDASVLN